MFYSILSRCPALAGMIDGFVVCNNFQNYVIIVIDLNFQIVNGLVFLYSSV